MKIKIKVKAMGVWLKKRWRPVTIASAAVIVILSAVFFLWFFLENRKDDPVLAVVNGYKIRVSNFKKQMAALPEFYQAYAAANRSQFLRDLIDRELVYQKARRSPYAGSAHLRERLEELKKDLLVQEYVQKEILENPDIPEREMKQYYQTHPMDFIQPASVHLYEIMVSDLKTAENIVEKFRKGDGFEDLARNYSEAPSRSRGGNLGFVREGSLPIQLERVAFQLPPNGLSSPLKTEDGYYLLMARQKIPSRHLSYEESVPLIKKILSSKQGEENFTNFLKNLRARSRIKVMEDNLEKIEF